MPRRSVAIVLAVALVAAGGVVAPTTLAQFVDQGASSISLSTDTLAPPTSLAASGTTSASLTWIPSSDAYAAGYQVLRSTTSGGGYSLVGSVTPGAANATTDAPGPGTFYYVLRSYFQNWQSVNSNEASITVSSSITTPLKGCTAASNAPDTGGDNNGYETTPGNACGDDALSATDANTGTNFTTSCANAGKDRHRFWDFNLGVPAAVTSVDGITVRVDSGMNNNGGTNNLCVELSWNGGATWTAAQVYDMATSAITTYTLGGPTDTWGRAWTGVDFSNAAFRVRVTDASSQPNKNYLLEYLAVQVTYRP
ncbi:MAG TPA: hypothetical protein VFV72_13860 [Candidatus Limnocylindrales bacterium]|nr:hypothetical protein [Candidatus Limnocylindrales bacterium]